MKNQIKSRIYPNFYQKLTLDNHFDAYRFVYNLCLEYRIMLWRDYKKSASGYDMQK